MVNFGNIVFMVTVATGSILLLWEVSKTMLEKKKIFIFVPFICLAIFFALIGATGFFAEDITDVELFFMKTTWISLAIWLAINLWRKKWN